MYSFIKADPKNKLEKKYNELLREAFVLSQTNSQLSNEKYLEAEKLKEQFEISLN